MSKAYQKAGVKLAYCHSGQQNLRSLPTGKSKKKQHYSFIAPFPLSNGIESLIIGYIFFIANKITLDIFKNSYC